MGFTPHIMYRVAILIAGVAAVPVEVQNNFGPGPSGVPYGPRPGPSYGPLPQGDPQRSYKAKPILVEEEEEFLPQPYNMNTESKMTTLKQLLLNQTLKMKLVPCPAVTRPTC